MSREGIQMHHRATIGQLITKVAGFYYINESQQGSSGWSSGGGGEDIVTLMTES